MSAAILFIAASGWCGGCQNESRVVGGTSSNDNAAAAPFAPAITSSDAIAPAHQNDPVDAASVGRINLGRGIDANDASLRVVYAIEPSFPPPMNEPFAIDVRIDLVGDAQVDAVALTVDAGMPDHGHGMNVEPTITLLSPKLFRVENMVFHMSGRWEIYFDVTRDGVTSRAQDEITLE